MSTLWASTADFQFQVIKYIDVACLPILILQYCHTLEDEIDLIWNSRWNLAKFLYLFSRYNVFVFIVPVYVVSNAPGLSTSICQAVNLAYVGVAISGAAVGEAILVIRTCAIWAKTKKQRIWLVSLYLVFVAIIFVLSILCVRSVVAGTSGCNDAILQGAVVYPVAVVACMMFLETVFLTLLVYRIVDAHRDTKSPLVRTLYRDAIVLYLCILVLSIANLVAFAVFPPSAKLAIDTLYFCMHSILSCAVILRVRCANSSVDEMSYVPFRSMAFGVAIRQYGHIRSFIMATSTRDAVPTATLV